jgi:hypothetical protein
MTNVVAALPTGGFVTNLICDDGSLVLTNPRGEQIVIRAKVVPPLQVNDVTAVRNVGTIYTNGEHRRTVQAAIFCSAGATITTVDYQTISGGTSLNCEFGRTTLGDGINQWTTFEVDPGAQYGMTQTLGAGYGSTVVKSWVESDTVI